MYYSAPKAGAHLSVFGEDIALAEALEWLKELDRKRLKMRSLGGSFSEPKEAYQSTPEWNKSGSEADLVFLGLQQFINNSKLLPHGAHFMEINLDGEPVFEDGNGNSVKITQLSDGFRSILSLTFELIRQMVRVYGAEEVFKDLDLDQGIGHFDLPGVVLIDEIDYLRKIFIASFLAMCSMPTVPGSLVLPLPVPKKEIKRWTGWQS